MYVIQGFVCIIFAIPYRNTKLVTTIVMTTSLACHNLVAGLSCHIVVPTWHFCMGLKPELKEFLIWKWLLFRYHSLLSNKECSVFAKIRQNPIP